MKMMLCLQYTSNMSVCKVHPCHYSYFASQLEEKVMSIFKLHHRDQLGLWPGLPAPCGAISSSLTPTAIASVNNEVEALLKQQGEVLAPQEVDSLEDTTGSNCAMVKTLCLVYFYSLLHLYR